MAALTQNLSPTQKKDEISVHGYVRENFDENCWINEVIQIIIQFYMNKGGSLYMCGNGDWGQVGLKDMKKGKFTPPFTQQNAVDVSAGFEHTLIVDIDGNVWGCGNAHDGMHTPQKLDLAYPVVSVAAGLSDSLLLLWNGHVALIHGEWPWESENLPIIIESLKNYKIIQIAAGRYHFACLAEDGALFCFGDAEYGQCGVGEQMYEHEEDSDNSDNSGTSSGSYEGYYVETPTKVKLQKRIVFVECGMDHTLLITSDGLTYSFGSGKFGKLGHGSEDDHFVPTLIDGLKEKNIIKCAGGVSHSICVNSEGIVWCFGKIKFGQRGFGKHIELQLKPKVVQYFASNKIKAIDCAAGASHSGIIASDGSLYVWGRSYHRELVYFRKDCYHTPQKFSMPQNKAVKHVSMQHTHTAIITKE